MSRRTGSLLLALGWVGLVVAAHADPSTSTAEGGSVSQHSTSGKASEGTVVLTRWSIDAGGTTSVSGGGFRLGATLGQPDAGLASAANLVLSAGFWAPRAAAPTGDAIFADGFESP